MPDAAKEFFEPNTFLAKAGVGRTVQRLKSHEAFFTQGSAADCVYFLQAGRAKLTVVSAQGKEATITLVAPHDFVGEESIASVSAPRTATATALGPCIALRIERSEMLRVLHEEHAFSDLFLQVLIRRGKRTQADLVDHLFNSSEKRLARILLLMSEFGDLGHAEPLIPHITQEALAEMIGTTRSRVSFFMNRFRQSGFVDYAKHGRIRVNHSLLKVMLNVGFARQNAKAPNLLRVSPPLTVKKSTKRAELA